MKYILFITLLICAIQAKPEVQQGTDTTIGWSGKCKHTLQCDKDIGRFVDVNVQFETPFPAVPQVLLALKTIDAAPAPGLKFEITLQSVSKSGFVYRATSYQEEWIGTIHVNWLAFLDSKTQVIYKSQQKTEILSIDDGGVGDYRVQTFEYEKENLCKTPYGAAFILGGDSDYGQVEINAQVFITGENSFEIDVNAHESALEWISFVAIISCDDQFDYNYVGYNVGHLESDDEWNIGKGSRPKKLSAELYAPQLVGNSEFFYGLSFIDIRNTGAHIRVSVGEGQVVDNQYEVTITTWHNTSLLAAYAGTILLKVENQCAIVYSECNYEGNSLQICSGEPVNSFEAQEWGKTLVKSVKVPAGRTLTMFDAETLKGNYVQVKENVSCNSSPWIFSPPPDSP